MCIRDRYQRRVRGNQRSAHWFSMQIFLRACGKTITLECGLDDTVSSLHAAVVRSQVRHSPFCAHLQQGTSEYYLVHAGRTLARMPATLRECNIDHGACIQALLPLKAGGNGLRVAGARGGRSPGLALRRTDSTMLGQDTLG
eukprot:TRINITY_DN118_c0_g1_i6.p1 TRINITY_DN118_c0_g1~~TRINITY_DN118_c0_g1_i6.p1  ORF type:complete len:142 (-),score=12.20 TRINITY_DN118_c0_g1_i6:488-913(-)